MNTETPMNSRAINAEEDPIRYRCPSWILRIAIKTSLKQKPSQLHKSNESTHKNHRSETRSSESKYENTITEIKSKSIKYKIKITLFSDLVLSFLNTAFLSVKLSEAIEMRQ
jgi:hypothetical protein